VSALRERGLAVWGAMGLVVGGVVARVLAPFFMDLRQDGETYAAMGHAWALAGSFIMRWGDVTTYDCTLPQWSHHYPPLYPLYLGLVYLAAGFGVWQTKLAAVAMSLAALAVVFATTRDLYGSDRAWLASGLIAAEPHFIWVTGTGFSENMVLLLFALTMWGILKSLKDQRYIVVAGIAAALSYLTRSSMGTFFVVAGLAGLLWRFYFMRWQVFRNRSYLLAIVIFGTVVAAWALRNAIHFGLSGWQTSSYLVFTQNWAYSHPGLLFDGLAWKAPLFALYLAQYMVPLGKETRLSLRNVREEHESALWLSVFLVAVIGCLIATIFWTWEQYDVWWIDNHRYLVIAFLPLAWALLRHADVRSRGFALRYGVLALSLVLVSAYLFVSPVQYPEDHIAKDLDPLLRSGTQVGFAGYSIIKYSEYPYLTRHDISMYGCRTTTTDACPGQSPDYIISLNTPLTFAGYHVIATEQTRYFDVTMISKAPFLTVGPTVGTAQLWARDGPAPPGPRPAGCANPA
jgi:4-amino-4-deoxy-L-arabinose transferase-like glycosyltransferase